VGSTKSAESPEVSSEEIAEVKRRTKKQKTVKTEALSMYVLKFNSPILPYAKFPLTHNRYI